MSKNSRPFWALAIILVGTPSLLAQPAARALWQIPSAPARFSVEPDQEGPVPLISEVKLCLPDPKWASLPIRVFTDSGIAVGSDILWMAPGEPVTLIFDTSSGSQLYYVYVGAETPAMHLPDTKAGVWLEARQGDGKAINSLPEMLHAWQQSRVVFGRDLLSGIYEGGNRFGPAVNLFEHFQGWVNSASPEHLNLALMSTDASFVLVDGKEVVESPGLHDRWYDPSIGPPQGAIDLATGLHRVDCYYAFVQSGTDLPIVCSLAVKGGAFDQWTTLLPQNTFFRPVMLYRVKGYEAQTNAPVATPAGAPTSVAINWIPYGECMFDITSPDYAFASMKLTCLGPSPGTITWTFDDGTTAQGQSVTHLFPRPGIRKVHVSLDDGAKHLATLTQTISVHPNWAIGILGPYLDPDNATDIMGRDPTLMTTSDLASCFAVFGAFNTMDALLKFLPEICLKMNEIKEADLPYLKDGTLFLAHEDWAHPSEVIQLSRAVIDRATHAQPTPAMIAMTSECSLALARLILKTSDRIDEVQKLIGMIKVSTLTADESRELNILQADLMLAQGDTQDARKKYQALTAAPSGADTRSSIRLTAKIDQARVFLERKDFDAAEDSLHEVASESPIETMAPDWALMRLRLYQEEKLHTEAYLWAKRLLPVITDNGRSELLFRLTELAFDQSDQNLAHKTLSELLAKYPYSEETAEAKEKWPGQG